MAIDNQYTEIEDINNLEAEGLLEQLLETFKDDIYKQLPCVVQSVNTNQTVDVKVIENDKLNNTVYTVPIKYMETSNAFIALAISKGDRGVIRFFDSSIDKYKINGSESFDDDIRKHSKCDGLFEIGFVPESEVMPIPNLASIMLSTKNGLASISLDKTGAIIITGLTNLVGTLQVTGGYLSSDGSVGYTGNQSIEVGGNVVKTMTIKNGLITGIS
jgi:hypothetical protein